MSRGFYIRTKEYRKIMSESMTGKKHSEETRRKMSESHKGHKSWNKGKTLETDSRIAKQSESMKGKMTKEKNNLWKGGISKFRHPPEFNRALKGKIRKRDDYTCQECGFNEGLLKYKLDIHHIDYDKRNNDSENLISLCHSCHSQTNFKREDWIRYFYKIN